MRKHFYKAVPLVFFLLSLILFSSCSNAQKSYDKGRYDKALSYLEKSKDMTSTEYLLKAKCFIAKNEEDKAQGSLFTYLILETSQSSEREYAVRHFLQTNPSDNNIILCLNINDGFEAQKALYKAYSRKKDEENASFLLEKLSMVMDFSSYVSLMLEAPLSESLLLDVLYSWYSCLSESEIETYLVSLNEFTHILVSEEVAKKALSLSDLLLQNEKITTDDILFSLVFKIKGNILDKLYDKVNAKIYWSQAYKLNPQDEELEKRLK